MGDDDRAEDHIADTLAAGAGLSDGDVAALVATEGPQRILELLRRGVSFDRDGDGRLALGREAAHGRNRILHAGGDATGAVVTETLIREVLASRSIMVIEGAQALSLIPSGNRDCVTGVVARRAGAVLAVAARRWCWRPVASARFTATPPIRPQRGARGLPSLRVRAPCLPIWSLFSSTRRRLMLKRIRCLW